MTGFVIGLGNSHSTAMAVEEIDCLDTKLAWCHRNGVTLICPCSDESLSNSSVLTDLLANEIPTTFSRAFRHPRDDDRSFVGCVASIAELAVVAPILDPTLSYEDFIPFRMMMSMMPT